VRFFRRRLRSFVTRRKMKGERGNPWWIPREDLKEGEGVPLTRIEKVEKLMHPMIHLTNWRFIPSWINSSLAKVQLTFLKALDKSSFIMIEGIFFSFMEWRYSQVKETTS